VNPKSFEAIGEEFTTVYGHLVAVHDSHAILEQRYFWRLAPGPVNCEFTIVRYWDGVAYHKALENPETGAKLDMGRRDLDSFMFSSSRRSTLVQAIETFISRFISGSNLKVLAEGPISTFAEDAVKSRALQGRGGVDGMSG
jgi:hypothetical protein